MAANGKKAGAERQT